MSDRFKVPYDQAVSMLKDDAMIHTFVNPAPDILIGADWERASVLKKFKESPPELSGPSATKSGHGLCVWDKDHWVFIETKSDETTTERL